MSQRSFSFDSRDSNDRTSTQEKKHLENYRASLLRFFLGGSIACIFSFACSVLYSRNIWQNYWQETIYRVQTTDFNILSHTLPTKLSHLILKDDRVEIQRTLNSNYGLFGIVVTDCRTLEKQCSSQKIVYLSDSYRSWRKELTASTITDAPYNILRSPPPLIAEGGYYNSRGWQWNVDRQVNSGKIIGRVYYIRNSIPTFSEDYGRWLGNIFNNSNTNRPYLLSAIAFISSGLFAWSIVWLCFEKLLQEKQDDRQKSIQKIQKQELDRLQEKKSQQEQIVSLRGENFQLIRDKENLKQRLAHNQQEYQQLSEEIQNLKDDRQQRQQKELASISKIEDLNNKLEERKQITDKLQILLTKKKKEVDIIRDRARDYDSLSKELQTEKAIEILEVRVKLEVREEEIQLLEKNIEIERKKDRSISQDLKHWERELREIRQTFPDRENLIQQLDREIRDLDNEKQELQENINEFSAQNDRLQQQIENLQSDLLSNDREKQQLQDRLISIKDTEATLEEAIAKENEAERQQKQNLKTIEKLTQKLNKVETEKRKMQQRLQEREKQLLSQKPSPETLKRVREMDAIKFAMNATIVIQPIPNKKELQQESYRYYTAKYSKKIERSIEKFELVNYLRHVYTNYDSLLEQLIPKEMQREEAREILKNRVNAAIWSKCQEWLP
jgi:hypothetical protein